MSGRDLLKQGSRVLVTGGAGFIGAHVVRALVSLGCSVRVLDDLSRGRESRLKGLSGRIELLRADIRSPAVAARAARDAQVVIHLAAVPSADLQRAHEVNLGGTLNLLTAVRSQPRSERARLVLVSSGAVYGRQTAFVLHEELPPRPAQPREVLTHASEQLARVFHEQSGVSSTCLRLFRTFGPDEEADRADASVVARFVRAAIEGTSPVIHGDGQQTRDLIYVDNAVSAILAAAEVVHPEPLNVASGEAVAINFLWTLVLELTGRRRRAIEPTYVPAPPWDPRHIRPQIQRACQALGWAPTVRLREGLARTVQQAARTDPRAWFSPRTAARSRPAPPPLPPQLPRPPIAASPARTAALAEEPSEELAAGDLLEVVEDEPPWAPVPALPGLGR